MMREILFRGKTHYGVWVYGSLVHRTMFYGSKCDEYFILSGGEFHCDFYDAEEVIEESVGQFTGLTDKNGKKIFEGDCINNPYNVVEFIDGVFCVSGDRLICDMGKNIEVIGNVHDRERKEQ